MAIRVAVAGAAGRMGQTVCRAVEGAEDMELTGRADPALGHAARRGPADADVLVDFTIPTSAVANAREAVGAGVHVVIGTTGFDPAELAASTGANIFIAPNFAIGAVLMMQFAVAGGTAHGQGRDHRAAPRPQGRRAQRHRGPDRRADGRGLAERRHPADPLGSPARAGRPPGGHPRRRRPDADDPPRLDRPRVVHARRAARHPQGRRADRVPGGRPREAARRA